MTQDEPSEEANGNADRKRALARARKQRYDARMKGDVSGDGKTLRKAVVLYLDDDARETLRRNRSQRKLLGMDPFTDSKLVEQLLTSHGEALEREFNLYFEANDAQTSIAKGERIMGTIRKQGRIISNILNENKELIVKVNNLKEIVSNFENRSDAEKWFAAEEKILLEHLHSKSLFGYTVAQDILKKMKGNVNDSVAFGIFCNGFEEYLLFLMGRIAGANG